MSEIVPVAPKPGDQVIDGRAGPSPSPSSRGLVVGDIRARLSASVVGRQMYLFGELPSTAGLMLRFAQDGATEGTTVIADAQTAGQGRRGRRWFSPAGVNVHVSVLFRPNFHVCEVGGFSLIAPLALADTVEDLGLSAAVRWPNDVLVGGRKVAATRMDTVTRGEEVSVVVLDAMVNVNADPAALADAIGPAVAATSLSSALGHRLDRSTFAAAYLSRLDAWVRRYRGEGAEPVLGAWRQRDVIIGRRIRAHGPKGSVEGHATGIDSRGQLVLQVSGQSRALASDEILVVE